MQHVVAGGNSINNGRRGKANGRGGRGRGRGRGRKQQRKEPLPTIPSGNLAAACAAGDDYLDGDDASSASYVLLRMTGNDKYLAPREAGVVYAAVRRRFRTAGSVPLARIAWRVIPQRNGWVQLRHVLTGRYMRLVPPPDAVQWVVRAEESARSFGKQTWFRLETPSGGPVELSTSEQPVSVHLKTQTTGAYVNYRVEDMVRGHGNSMVGRSWAASPRSPSTRILMEVLDAAALKKDADKWKPVREGCLAPCVNASAAAAVARGGGVGWSEVCWKHYAEPHCKVLLAAHGEDIGAGSSETAHLLKARWARLDCEKYVTRRRPPPPPVAIDLGSPEPHCAPLTDGMLLLLVSDRPNQFLCHYFESALLHGLRPTVLGWDDTAWASPSRKPWTYYLGGKLILPLEYMERCHYPDDALVVFTDHDVVFQGGYAALRSRYEQAVKKANGAPLIFSAETSSYPLELKGLYPGRPTDPSSGPANFLNSGMWMGPIGAAKALLTVMTGIHRGEKKEKLLRHYHMWGSLNTKIDPIPAAYNENDQTKYAGLYVAQEMAASCGHGRQYQSRSTGCFGFLHDGQRRCTPGCRGGASAQHPPGLPRMALDRSLLLFENFFHSGPHSIDRRDGNRVHHANENTPLVLHFNGPGKVVFEKEWGLPWDATAGKTPVLYVVEGLRAARRRDERRAAAASFERNVTFLDPWLRKQPGIGPLRFTCEVPLT